ncbi:AraC family transcriptional regulator [Bradyrhizobium sp. UFLA05-112]
MNRPQTQASYEARLTRVVDHIYAHLDDDIRLDDLAEIACISRYHWHRIYVAMRGETITATMRRLRLLRSADRLANSSEPIKAIAERAGYGAVDAFARAFRDAYGMTPADYRANGSHAAFKAATREQDAEEFPVDIVALPPTRCAAALHVGSYMQIDKAMTRLFSELGSRRLLKPGQEMRAAFLDDPDLVAVDQLRSKACTPVADDVIVPSSLEAMTLRGGVYARLSYRGPYADMKDAYRWLLGVWLPSSGHESDDAPIFETYRNNPMEVAPSDLLTAIHLPLSDRP